jgi:hypothetical protein
LSSVLTATGPQATYGNAEGRLKRFSGGGDTCRQIRCCHGGGRPLLLPRTGRRRQAPDGAGLGRRVEDRRDLAARDRATGPTTASSAAGTRRTSPFASSVRRLAGAANPLNQPHRFHRRSWLYPTETSSVTGPVSGEGGDVVEVRPVAVAGVHGEGRQGSASQRCEDVEFVALRVGQDRPPGLRRVP